VITTYVGLGLGVGIVAEMAVRGQRFDGLVFKPAGQLFGSNTARIAFKRGAYLRNFVLRFAELLSERLSSKLIQRAMQGEHDDYQL
jgi:LysR family transcriptional regulator, cys regulon transcriptional activator